MALKLYMGQDPEQPAADIPRCAPVLALPAANSVCPPTRANSLACATAGAWDHQSPIMTRGIHSPLPETACACSLHGSMSALRGQCRSTASGGPHVVEMGTKLVEFGERRPNVATFDRIQPNLVEINRSQPQIGQHQSISSQFLKFGRNRPRPRRFRTNFERCRSKLLPLPLSSSLPRLRTTSSAFAAQAGLNSTDLGRCPPDLARFGHGTACIPSICSGREMWLRASIEHGKDCEKSGRVRAQFGQRPAKLGRRRTNLVEFGPKHDNPINCRVVLRVRENTYLAIDSAACC